MLTPETSPKSFYWALRLALIDQLCWTEKPSIVMCQNDGPRHLVASKAIYP